MKHFVLLVFVGLHLSARGMQYPGPCAPLITPAQQGGDRCRRAKTSCCCAVGFSVATIGSVYLADAVWSLYGESGWGIPQEVAVTLTATLAISSAIGCGAMTAWRCCRLSRRGRQFCDDLLPWT